MTPGAEIEPGHIGGRQVLSPLGQPCKNSERRPENLCSEWTINPDLCDTDAVSYLANREVVMA